MKRTNAVAVLLALFAGCKHVPSEKDQQAAQIHYDLGVQVQQSDPQAAFQEFEAALRMDPELVEAHNALGVLLHLAFNRGDEAIVHYKQAIEGRPGFSEAKTNLANVYLDQHRYDEAIKLYEEVLNDMLYATPYIAHNNLGWAFYKKGDARKGLDQTKAAITTNPKFCLGYKNLGIINDEQGNTAEACKQFGRYRENCPAEADAYYREGLCQAKTGKRSEARKSFDDCVAKTGPEALKDDCRRLKEQVGP